MKKVNKKTRWNIGGLVFSVVLSLVMLAGSGNAGSSLSSKKKIGKYRQNLKKPLLIADKMTGNMDGDSDVIDTLRPWPWWPDDRWFPYWPASPYQPGLNRTR